MGNANVEELRRGGVVALRERDIYSIWVKTACGNLNSRQLRKLADISTQLGRGVVLFSSRQIPVIPFIHIENIPAAKAALAEVEMELDRCGPRVRNLNVCYEDKVCPQATVNCLSLAEKLESYFRSPLLFKVKIGVAGCRRDCVVAPVLSDIGFIGVDRDASQGYYDVYLGGRLGINPFVGVKIAERLPEDQGVKLVQNYFDLLESRGKPGERAADIVRRLGVAAVKSALNRDLPQIPDYRRVDCPSRQSAGQTDKSILRLRATCGEVTAGQLVKIADVAEKYGLGFVHFPVRGSPEIPGVPRERLPGAVAELERVGLKPLDNGIENMQTCYGVHCAESHVNCQSLLHRIEQKVEELGIDNRAIRISASGCPNSCGIAHLSDIGFYGVAEPEVSAPDCTGCRLCLSVCKRKAITIPDNVAVIDHEQCRDCGQCASICPTGAILEKRKGYAVLVGGKEGEDVRLGELITEFVSEDAAFAIAGRALKLVKEMNIGVAEIIDKIGLERFRELVLANEIPGLAPAGEVRYEK